MHFRHCSHVGWFKRVLFFVLLIAFLVCGEKEEAVVGLSNQKPNMQEKQLSKRKQLQHQEQEQVPKYPFDVFVLEKRKVPNASDPLHNR
ncbi:hypothetical protein Lal_00045706 [Lupinus albus]|uniref:Uncharacterized protein n=1 Tax=Lupinus albus TaxID=3870 RepID=A0A6A5NFH3_LUPAL|nr:hypothetical protein Lalb_Chr14g0368431 [Lupinus albus]KAF1886474.1 hypothetical protein Lal_00045706 [Lupinus albus]